MSDIIEEFVVSEIDEEPVVEEAVVEEPVVEENVVEEPVTEEAVVEEQVAEVEIVEEPVTEEAVVEEQVAEVEIVEEPVTEEAVVEEPVTEEAVVEEPVTEEAVVEEPVAEVEIVEEPVTEEAVVEEPVTEEPVTEEPAISNIQMDDIYPPENITFIIDNPAPITPSLIFIVPYRDRQKQYEFYSNHMKVLLEDMAPVSYKILYLHQKDEREFNRGAMKNIGFITVKSLYPNDYKNITLVFNDIDIMPYTKNFLNYHTVSGVVKHFYGFTFTLGGIVSITAGDFEKINGFPNFWAWGYEDNLLQTRVVQAGLTIDRGVFYPILDPNMLHFSEGITRNMNRTEYDLYKTNTSEGIDSISNIQQIYDEITGFVDITYFYTPREDNPETRINYDLRGGPTPFTNNMKTNGSRRNPRMKMML
jgi:hypothetical protein